MPEPVFDPEPQEYDVSRVVRDYSSEFLHTEPNLATPLNLSMLVEELQELTDAIVIRDRERRGIAGTEFEFDCVDPTTGEAFDQLCLDLQRWQIRLHEYQRHLDAVPEGEERNRGLVLWEVTAPLFLGYHGGQTGVEVPLIPDGYPPGFNVNVQHVADLATPFSLANEMGVYEEFEAEQWDRFLDDLLDAAGDVPEVGMDLATAVLIGFGMVAGVGLLTRLRKG